MALVDTLDEQALLEELIDATKPAVPEDCRGLHYLLSTPFRYGALYPTGSRFRRAGSSAGVFYASRDISTGVAEMAFRRLLFFAESPATAWPINAAEYTAFSVRYSTAKGLDLTAAPFKRDAATWKAPIDYSGCQAFAETARSAGIMVLVHPSARVDGVNVALLACAAFRSREPIERQVWRIRVDEMGVRALCAFPPQQLAFSRDAFARDQRIAKLNWDR